MTFQHPLQSNKKGLFVGPSLRHFSLGMCKYKNLEHELNSLCYFTRIQFKNSELEVFEYINF